MTSLIFLIFLDTKGLGDVSVEVIEMFSCNVCFAGYQGELQGHLVSMARPVNGKRPIYLHQ